MIKECLRNRLKEVFKKIESISDGIIYDFRDPNTENFESIFKPRKLAFQWNLNHDQTQRIEEVMAKGVKHCQAATL